ncbi:MAG: hypothetical protein OES35_03810, partial [Chromatiales bacterium]|nr:hypothetical protein [Chromatiales bacterium]
NTLRSSRPGTASRQNAILESGATLSCCAATRSSPYFSAIRPFRSLFQPAARRSRPSLGDSPNQPRYARENALVSSYPGEKATSVMLLTCAHQLVRFQS